MEDRYSFLADWYDPHAAMKRQYLLVYYPIDSTCEMVDLKNHRLFLKRSPTKNVHLDDLYIGSTVTILSRQLKIVDFGDQFTRSKLQSTKESTLAIIKPDCIDRLVDILDVISSNNFTINKMRKIQLSSKEAQELYAEHKKEPFYDTLTNFMSSGPILAIELIGDGAINRWRDLIGPPDPATAREQSPLSLRAQFGTNDTQNGFHGSDSPETAQREIEFFFSSTTRRGQNTATYSSNCTLGIIKPDAFKAGLTSNILNDIVANGDLQISAIGIFNIEKANAEEFFEIYKGVVREYTDMVTLLSSGPCVAFEVTGSNAQQVFRQLTGPADPEMARHLRPHTLRAKYGRTKVENAVHCTDLPEDGVLEVEYFFKIMDTNY